MRIGDILKENQLQELNKLNKLREKPKEKKDKLSYLTERDIKELMGHSSYRRSSGGAIRQVRI